eukprot:TRINITY_DN11691_c0_g1_i1.p2 TRINITY_DN11691_c0_g1~~TRINITY_DN11691_c0_g1_i1.p2  ORF type:complete len:52 (+),score=3.98 TRINITY_DN11691_c0_g1_i1:145-300(+)
MDGENGYILYVSLLVLCIPTHTQHPPTPHRGILFSHEKEENPAICNNMDGS